MSTEKVQNIVWKNRKDIFDVLLPTQYWKYWGATLRISKQFKMLFNLLYQLPFVN